MGYGSGAYIGSLLFSLLFVALSVWLTWRIIEKAGYPGWYALAIGVIGFILGLIPFVGFLVQIAQLALLYAFAFVRWPREGGAIPFGGGIPGIAPAPGGYGSPGGYPPPAGFPPATGYPPQPGYPQQPGYAPPGYPQQPGYPPQGYPQQPGYPPPQGYPQQPGPGQPPGYPPPQQYGQPPGGYPPPVPGPGGYGQPPVAPPPSYGQPPVAPPPPAPQSAQPSPPPGGELEPTVIPGRSSPPPAAPPGFAPPAAPAAAPGWTLSTPGPGGAPFMLSMTEGKAIYVVSGQGGGGDLIVPEASIGNPHARVHLAPGRVGLEDLGSPGGTAIDGAQLLPSHGIREITQSRKIRFGALEFSLARS